MARQHKNKWMADVIIGNKRQRKVFNTREEAEAFEQSMNPSTNPHTIKAIFQHGCDTFWLGTRNQKDALRHTEFLINYFGPAKPVSTITTAAIQDMATWLQKEKRNSPATINRKLAALSKLLTHARKRGAITEVPDIDYKAEENQRKRFLTKEEEEAIFEHLNDRHRAFATFLLYTGCRVGEALKLRWSDIKQDAVTFFDTKNGDDRTVPLGNRAKAALQYTKGQGWVSPFARIQYDAFNAGWNRAKKLAGLGADPDVVPHILRHTCASRMVQGNGEKGVDLYRVKEWLGHRSISVTQRYAHLKPSDLKDALAFLEG